MPVVDCGCGKRGPLFIFNPNPGSANLLDSQGFRMTVGKPTETVKQHAGLSYQCMSGGSRGTIISTFPKQKCTGGIFTTHHFPP